MMPKFGDDLNDTPPTPSQSLAVNILPTLPASSTVSNNHAISDKRAAEASHVAEEGAKWQPLDKKKDKLDYDPKAEQHAAEIAASDETLALREAEARRVSALVFDAKGKLVLGSADIVRTEEVVADAPTYTIIRYNDGTVRKDLIKKEVPPPQRKGRA